MKRILVVSNSAVDRISLSRMLKAFGEVKTLKELVKPEGAVDLIVLSFTEEESNISSLIEELIENFNTPVILISPISKEEINKLKEFFSFEYFVYIERNPTKPITYYKDVILAAAEKLLSVDRGEIKLKKKIIFERFNYDFFKESLSQKDFQPRKDLKFVLIGASTGGPGLIEAIVRNLPENYPYPVCVVQHMPTNFTAKFAKRLDTVSKLKVVEANDGEEVAPGKVIIGKGGKHLHFMKRDGKVFVKLVPNTRKRFFCPSVDEMFLSAKEVIGGKNVMAVLLTGIGDDGADGMVALKRDGAYTIAESEETAAVYGMPKEAYERGGTVKVLPFPEILKEIVEFGKA